MTNQWTDVKKSDCVMVCGSNCAESHPISFKWIEAAMHREKSPAKLIVVDPRFTRTAARADIFAQIRPGTDIVFFGGLVNYALQNNMIQKDYVLNYTNASFLVNPKYSFNDKTGLFSGYDPAVRKYDPASWAFQFDKYGLDGKPAPDAKPLRDATLQNPQCVFQILKNHFSRYTPEKVEGITGIPKDKFVEIAKTYCATSENGKSGTLMYAMGLCHHTYGTQNIRTFAILQLLLGNIGMPGGGINALRGESNVQSSTDFALLWGNWPGYLSAPNSTKDPSLVKLIENFRASKGAASFFGANCDKFYVSLLKSWYGENATAGNEFAYQWLPKVKEGKNYSHIALFEALYRQEKGKEIKGLILWGQNPCVGGPNANMEAKAMENLEWLVAVDLWETESSVFWKRPGATGAINTEVFLLPAASSIEKEGSVTNSGRVIQWRYKAVNPPGEAKSDGAIVSMLMHKLIELYKADPNAPNREAMVDMYWPYNPEEPDPDMTMKEINGFGWAGGKPGNQVKNFTVLKADGSTACGNWVFSGIYPAQSDYPGMDKPETKTAAELSFKKTGGNLAKRTNAEDKGDQGIYAKWAFAWPVNRRIIYNRCSADPAGQPWNPDKNLVKWDGAKWVNIDVPDFKATDAALPGNPPVPPNVSAANPYIMQPYGMGHLFAPTGLADGPFPEHYEPVESPFKNAMSAGHEQYSPVAKIWSLKDSGKPDMDQLAEPGNKQYPIVATTWRLTEHWQAGQMTRNLPWLAEMQPEMIVELSKDLAKRKGIKNGDTVLVKSIRGGVECVALVTERVQVLKINGTNCDVVGLPWHYGYTGYITGGPNGRSYAANQLTPHLGDANTMTPEYKAFLVDIEKA